MKTKSALVVEGGGMRGIFAAGVLDTFMDYDFKPFDFVIGVSAGASNLIGYLSDQPLRSYQIITRLATTKAFYNPARFVQGGNLVDVKWLIDESNRLYPINEERLFSSIPFFATATNIATGKADYYQVSKQNFTAAIEATSALPLVYRETPCFSGECYTDGGIADSIPVIEAYRRGAREITIILSKPVNYRMKKPKSEWMMKRLFARYPNVAEAVIQRADNYNRSLDFIQNPPADAKINVIAPPKNFAVKRLTMKKSVLDEGYLMGVNKGYDFVKQRECTV
jgi:predicted patatin/cPLA2 family phospholipase